MAETPSDMPHSQIVEGLRIPTLFSADAFRSGMRYKPRKDDVIIATFPKCGTTWTQHVVDLIFRHGEKPASSIDAIMTPFLDAAGAEGAENVPRPGSLKCHYPFHMVPWSDDAKYIYVTRNPKDACVSFYHHMKNISGIGVSESFDSFFDRFIAGNVDYGDYFDHLLGWYKHRNDPNVLFMTYEEMKKDIKAAILKIASFMDDKLYAEPLRSDPEKLENIVKYSSVKHMKESVNKAMEDMFNTPKEEALKSNMPEPMKKLIATRNTSEKHNPNTGNFVRKGIVGDWRNHFSEEQSKRMDEKFAERTKGTEIANWWKEYM
ncbi:amine sulfotransferase-like [Uloborus diversus]|uniref:amine sulfotransferase-like n=1 Tax=Uloborus diversus TaxID=327109 RepID=UPI0024095D90|nr:amine sulfotransferase-like [Uloborus diversus]